MTRAFTLLEMICVTVIVAVLASFLFPVFAQAVHSSKVTAQMGKFHQLHLAFSLYRTDHDGDARWGKSSEMGLPSYDQLEGGSYLVVAPDRDLWSSSCGTHPELASTPAAIRYVYPPCDMDVGCGDYYRMHRDDSMLLIDVNCIDNAAPFESPFHQKLIVGVRLNGQVEKKLTTNHPDLVANWHPKG